MPQQVFGEASQDAAGPFRHWKSAARRGREPPSDAGFTAQCREWALSNAGVDTGTMISRYYLHIVKGNVRVNDRIGVELRKETVMSRSMLKVVKERWPGTNTGPWQGWSVEITDADGRVVRMIALDELD